MAARGINHASTTELMLSGNLGCWVAEADGRIVAFSMVDRRDGNVFALFTLPKYERRGFGAQLLERCESWLKENDVKKAYLDTARKSYALKFYLKHGWKVKEETHADPEDVYLVKTLFL
jgi:GNAT superfamily N-acetyltransferase